MVLHKFRSGAISPEGGSGLKRLVDLCLVLLTLPLTLPLMVVIAVAIRLSSAGPLVLRLSCVGRNGVVFRQYRFRMIQASPSQQRTTGFQVTGLRNDGLGECRLTPVGTLLLVTGLNRLPQIFNVLKGEMSLIGPAAISVAAVTRNGHPDSRLFAARPGIVSPELFLPAGQEFTESDRMALALAYAGNAGASTDGRLLLQSASRALRRRSA